MRSSTFFCVRARMSPCYNFYKTLIWIVLPYIYTLGYYVLGITLPSSPSLSRLSPISRGEESCERRFGGRRSLASLSASTAARPPLRGLRPRHPPPPETHSLPCSLCGDNDDVDDDDDAAAKIRLLAYDGRALHAGLFKIQKAGRAEGCPRGEERRTRVGDESPKKCFVLLQIGGTIRPPIIWGH